MDKPGTIVVFACNWDGLSCIETAANQRLTFPATVKVVRVSCLSRVHTGLMLKALELGADGVMLLGCDAKGCHFGVDEEIIDKNFETAQSLMRLLGLRYERLLLTRLPHGDGEGFVKRVKEFASQEE
jgi:F420-non-reducing hydrogenase iron-sulfur subunit